MKKILWLLAFVNLWFNLPSQNCKWSLDYEGPPGDVQEHLFENAGPNSWWQIDFAAFTIIDTLKFISGSDTVVFQAGGNLPDVYRGYLEYTWGDVERDTSPRMSDTPLDFSFSEVLVVYGCIRINYQVPKNCCSFKILAVGNGSDDTWYRVCVKKAYDEEIPVDTITEITCDDHNWYESTYDESNCKKTFIIHESHAIGSPNIHNPSCWDESDGYLEFQDTTIYNLLCGYNEVTVYNQYCSKIFQFYLYPESICKNFLYIPNVFSPNEDGINDIFTVYYPINEPFKLKIWNRWGDLVKECDGVSNVYGWDGGREMPDVFVYEIIIKGNKFTGDITLVK